MGVTSGAIDFVPGHRVLRVGTLVAVIGLRFIGGVLLGRLLVLIGGLLVLIGRALEPLPSFRRNAAALTRNGAMQ